MAGSRMNLRFSGEIWHWRGPAPWYFVTVPEDECAVLSDVTHLSYGWGMIPVTARIGGSRWATSLFPKDGRYLVPIKAVVRRAENLDEGSTVEISLDVGAEPSIQ
jgi:hypothetical protein